MPLHVSSTCAHLQEVRIALNSLWYHHTYRCDDTRGCVMQFWPPDDEHTCSKHVEAWNKLIVKQTFCTSSWLITEINILRCTVSKTSKSRLFVSVKLLSLLTYRSACLFWLVYSLFSDAAGNSRDLIWRSTQKFDTGNWWKARTHRGQYSGFPGRDSIFPPPKYIKSRIAWVSLTDITYLLTYLLTPWCRVHLGNLTGLQLVKKFPAFHGTRRFITALTSVRRLSLSWASPIQTIYPHPTSWRSILILSTHLRLGLPSGLLPSGFSSKTLYTPSSHPYAPHAQPI